MAKHNDTSPEGRSVRLLREGEQVRHILSDLLARGEVHDDVLTSHSVSVTEVRMSPDLRHATVFIKPLLGENEDAVLKALRTNTAFLQREVAAGAERAADGDGLHTRVGEKALGRRDAVTGGGEELGVELGGDVGHEAVAQRGVERGTQRGIGGEHDQSRLRLHQQSQLRQRRIPATRETHAPTLRADEDGEMVHG